MSQRTIRGWRGGSLALAVAVAVVLPAAAADIVIEVSVDTVVRAAPGSEHTLAVESVPAGLVGRSCRVRAVARNQQSVHPGNDLVISSGDDRVVLPDVEGEPLAEKEAESTIILGEAITVTLVMGPDGIFSAGITVSVRCPETTTTTEPTTTTVAPTTEADTTTTVEPTTTIVPETTTTTEVATTTTTPPATSPPTTPPATLPFTGVGSGGVWAALLAAAAGLGLTALARRHSYDEGGEAVVVEEVIAGVRVRIVRSGGSVGVDRR